jgi:hypothetical protein
VADATSYQAGAAVYRWQRVGAAPIRAFVTVSDRKGGTKLMRQAKPDDVLTFVTLAEITALFPLVTRYLGRSRDFWTWLLDCWKALPSATQ